MWSSCMVLTMVSVLMSPTAASAADGRKVTFMSGKERISAELFLPDARKHQPPYPGIIAIHEWWGLNDQVRGEARKLAAEGFAVLAVDLYRGRVAQDRDEAHELMRGLPTDRAMGDLKAAFSYLSEHPSVWSYLIGSIGWCMGGGYSLDLAAEEPRLAAAVVYYGRLITDEKRLSAIRANVYGFFGEEDRGIPSADVLAFEAGMKRRPLPASSVDIHLYPGAGHAFANAARPSYHDTAARDAWAKTVHYLKSDLDGAIVRVKKTMQTGDTSGDLSGAANKKFHSGLRVIYTILMENDGNDAADSFEIVDDVDSKMTVDLSASGKFGDLWTDSGLPSWRTFDVRMEYVSTRDFNKYQKARTPDVRNPSDWYRPLTRKTPPESVAAIRWSFRAISAGARNSFLAPDDGNDDRRTLDGIDTRAGRPTDPDAAFLRFAAYVR